MLLLLVLFMIVLFMFVTEVVVNVDIGAAVFFEFFYVGVDVCATPPL